MAKFIEIKEQGEKFLLNLDLVNRIIPVNDAFTPNGCKIVNNDESFYTIQIPYDEIKLLIVK